jgi:hypothetical protein
MIGALERGALTPKAMQQLHEDHTRVKAQLDAMPPYMPPHSTGIKHERESNMNTQRPGAEEHVIGTQSGLRMSYSRFSISTASPRTPIYSGRTLKRYYAA